MKDIPLRLNQMILLKIHLSGHIRELLNLLNFCKQEHYIEDYKKVKMPRNDARQIIPLYAEEVEKIDQTFKINTMMGLRDFCIVHLMLDAGFRSQEVINLKIQDVLLIKMRYW